MQGGIVRGVGWQEVRKGEGRGRIGENERGGEQEGEGKQDGSGEDMRERERRAEKKTAEGGSHLCSDALAHPRTHPQPRRREGPLARVVLVGPIRQLRCSLHIEVT